MYYIVEKQEQLEGLEATKKAFIQLICNNSTYHSKLAQPSLVYYNNGEKGYILAISHSESFSLYIESINAFLSKHETIYLIDKKYHSYHLSVSNCIDLNLVSLDSKNEIKELDCNTQFHRSFYQNKSDLVNIDYIIPISKHYEKCECFYDEIKYLMGLELDNTFDNLILDAYGHVENNGIGVKEEYINKVYQLPNSSTVIRDSVAYSSYNLYNITGRPTNSFGGINFLAIPKEGGYRSCFVPTQDFFVEFDFDSYHLRLIAKLVSETQPNSESLHKIIAGQYFNKPTNEVTDEEYKQAKVITFRQLYGGVDPQYQHIGFFSKLSEYVETEWKKYKAQRSYSLPTGRVVKYHSTITKYKLFNYILQNLETKTNVEKIIKIKDYLSNKKTKLVLITYDAFLFDFSSEDGKDTLIAIKDILQEDGFPVKHVYGKDYSFTQ